MQADLEQTDALSSAAKAINPADGSYDPQSVLTAYALLEAEYGELTQLQRGSAEYIARAKELTDQTTASIYEQAAAYGVVTNRQAQAAQATANGQRERRFKRVEENGYQGGVSYLESIVRKAEEAGEDVTAAWNNALDELDAAGHLDAMCQMFGDISNLAVECGGDVEEIVRRLYEMRDAAQSISLSDMAEELRRERTANAAETDSYDDQVGALLSAFGAGGTEGVLAAMEVWNGFDESLQQSVAETYPSLVIALDDANQAAQSLKEGVGELAEGEDALSESSQTAEKKMAALGTELNAAKKSSSAKYFKSTAKAIEELKHGAVSVSDAFGTYNKEAETAVKANEEYQAASKKMAAGTKVAASEIDTLAEYLGNINPQILLANWDQVGPMLSSALAEGEDAFRRLNEAAFISITGTSVADFSALTSGLISVQNLAADAVDALIATGQWTMETITMPQEGAQWNPLTGVWTRTRINTNQNVLRYTGSNPLKGGSSGKKSSGGGGGGKGGGGGGNSSTSVSQSTQKLLDKMDEAVDTGDHRRKMAQLAQQYHEVRGEIQGVILYLGKEKEIVQENSTTLTGYIAELENQMAAQKAIMSKNKEGSKKYKQAATDLEALQKQHQQYSETLLQNKIDLEELTKEIKEQRDAIRDMEIDLRDLIHDAILDREALNKRMLEGQIDVENELIDVITRRYEKERDQLIELAEAKRDALNEELTALDEQLAARKKLSEEEDKAKTLAEKEAQLARISADPTRKKEELKLRQEIADLREEMAWDIAEDEVDAQKKAIESQIESLDDYIEYVENYYEELLNNPRKLLEELKEMLSQSDAEIIDWLTKNHEDYETATDATRENMRRGWQEMLDDMRGHTTTYWKEVEEIIAGGDDAIIQFLKDNCQDYKDAGKLQAEAYVDEWKKKLEDLRNAYKQVSGDIKAYDYTPTTSAKNSGSSSKGSSSSKKTTKVTKYQATYPAIGSKRGGTLKGYTSPEEAEKAARSKINSICRELSGSSSSMIGEWARSFYSKIKVTAYAKGGLNQATGLAWLDGTKSRPERILSPYQTELFEDLLKTLHAIRTVQAPQAVVRPQLPETVQNQPLTIESITVNVERLEKEADYDAMAERVGEKIMERAMRGMAVGGLRLG